MNTILFICEIILTYTAIIYLYKKYKLSGLDIWITIVIALSNPLLKKTINVSSFDINLAIVTQSTIFIVQNIIIQKQGLREGKKVINNLVISSLLSYTILSLNFLLDSSTINLSMNEAYNNLFSFHLLLYLSNLLPLIISLFLNSKIYYELRKAENKIWISNTISAIIVNFINCLLFGLFYLITKVDLHVLIATITIRYILSLTVSLIGTLVIYYLNNLTTTERK